MRNYTFRLRSGRDLFETIETFVREKSIEAGCILSCSGSLTRATIRLANRELYSIYDGFFEIVSLTGTLSVDGSHVHLSMADEEWKTVSSRPLTTLFTNASMQKIQGTRSLWFIEKRKVE